MNLLPCSEDDPNDKANSSDDDGVIEKEDRPIGNGVNGMALGPIAEIVIGLGSRPTYVPRYPFHGGVGITIG